MSEELVTLEYDGPVAFVTLNSPGNRNSMSRKMMHELIDAFRTVGKDTDVRAVVLASTGKVFSAGHDLREVQGSDHATQQNIFDTCTLLMRIIQSIPQPVIAEVQGLATAAGCQLVATCDLAVASESASFATPGVTIGLFCSTPMVALSRAVNRKAAMRMLLTGEPIKAEEAFQRGLVSHTAPAYALRERTLEVARTVAQSSSTTVSIGKRAFYEQISLSATEAYSRMGRVMADNAVLNDAQEGITAFLEKRSPEWSHDHSEAEGLVSKNIDRD